VHDVKQFCDTVLPQFFQHANWSSFTRQLANYGFARVADAGDAFEFEHPLFARNQPASLAAIVRRVVKVAESEPEQKSATAKRARASSPVPVVGSALVSSLASLHAKVDVLSACMSTLLQNNAQIVALLQATSSESATTALPSLFDGLEDIAGEPFDASFRNFPAF
jgi:hypothetical protein